MRRRHDELIDINNRRVLAAGTKPLPIGLTAPAWTVDRGFGPEASLTLRHQSKPPGARVGGAPCQRGAGDVASNIACQCASDVDPLRDLKAYTPGMDRLRRNESRRDGFGSR